MTLTLWPLARKCSIRELVIALCVCANVTSHSRPDLHIQVMCCPNWLVKPQAPQVSPSQLDSTQEAGETLKHWTQKNPGSWSCLKWVYSLGPQKYTLSVQNVWRKKLNNILKISFKFFKQGLQQCFNFKFIFHMLKTHISCCRLT